MIADEYKTWYRLVQKRFPEIDTWLADRYEKGGEGDITVQEIMQDWRDELGGVRLEDAQAAVVAMFRQEIPKSRPWSQFPVDICRYAKRLARDRGDADPNDAPKPKFVGDEQVYECSLCLDDGRVIVIHRETQKRFLDDPASFDLKTMNGRIVMGRAHYECAIACRCRMGDRWVERGIRRIDDSWCLADQTPEQVHAWLVKFREWWLERNQSQGDLVF